ncbi:hypothetical protein [Hydrogenophaga pseudoflava]|uniref:hypothetical protein n=1 Tax=Hydrogenophaga pseudoflava TaxID=47421 RepID=UPI0027E532BA|nr:hypothetical protein [Hydrogenophaga pseudoflava]MDQ7744451.1 hypothetical protein [Hydrogenophaga pseudoflava]
MRQILVGSILLSTALGGSAATLGRHSGAVVIGRPLDIRVQAVAAPGEDVSALCLQADVFFGDYQLGPASIRTTTQHNAPDAEASVRIQTTVPVNEPVVSVILKAGCASPFSRRYVLLADLLSEPATVSQPSPAPSGQQEAQRPLPSPAAGATGNARVAPGTAAVGGEPPAATTRNGPPAAVASRPKPASVVRKPEPPREAAPRLQLDPVDVSLAIERDPVLRLSLSLLSEPASNPQERAAAAQLWKALNASPEEILRDAQKLAVLEAESKGLREQEARHKAAMQDLEARLEQSRVMSWAAYALGALLLLALAALAWLWRRKAFTGAPGSTQKNWWASGAAKMAKAPAEKPAGKAPAKGVDLDLDLDADSGMDELAPARRGAGDSGAMPLSSSERRDFRPSHMGVSRSVATEELFDVQQQSDFFVSLGEFDQAIGVLKTHLHESQEPSALAYLDLFKLYHRTGRRDEYEKLRDEFNHQFNASAPPFDQYSDSSRGLEAYETAFGRIQALWPQPKVLDVIEKSIFRDSTDPESEVFDLEAYRELLLLHAIAKDVIQRDSNTPSSDFQHTAIRPLKAADPKVVGASAAASGRLTEPLDSIPHASPRLGLDIDLDALHDASAFEASLPDVAVPVEPTAKPAPPPVAAVTTETVDMGNLIDFEVLDFMPPEEVGDDEGKSPRSQ